MRGFAFGLSSVLALGYLSVAVAGDGLKSGLQVGDSAPPFHVLDVTGPSAGTKLCYK